MRPLPDKRRISEIAAQHLQSMGHGDPELRRIDLVTLDPQRREMLAFIKRQQLTHTERKKVLTLYRSRPRQEWSLMFFIRYQQSAEKKSAACVKLDIKGNVNDVVILGRPRGAA